jgi:WD40 repeat protein
MVVVVRAQRYLAVAMALLLMAITIVLVLRRTLFPAPIADPSGIITLQPLTRFGTWNELYNGGYHHSEIRSLAFSSDSKLLASGGEDKLLIWDVAKKEMSRASPIRCLGGANTITFLPDTDQLVAGQSRNASVWRPTANMPDY